MNLHRLAQIVALTIAPITSGQYSLTATATATNSPDEIDMTATEPSVFASNNGGSINADNPSSVSTNAGGSPNDAGCFAFAAAESTGPIGFGTGFARLRSLNDTLVFDAAGPFTVRVSFDLKHNITTNWDRDFGRVEASGTVRRVLASGATIGTPGFAYDETASNGQTTIDEDRRDPIEIDMQPGDGLRLGLSLVTTATTTAIVDVSDGNVRADATCRLFVEVITGDASLAGSTSGADYGPPPCAAADLALPFGVLDLADVDAFVTAFLAADAAADLAAPFGVIDLADVDAFVIQFLAGCP